MDPPATEDIEGAIGRAVTFTSGTLAGQTIRTKLVVLQDGGFTRKTGSRDRRVLDPPQVLRLLLYRTVVDRVGEEREEEVDYAAWSSFGFVAQTDIYEIPEALTNERVVSMHMLSAQDVPFLPAPDVVGMVGQEPLTDGLCATRELTGSKATNAFFCPLVSGPALLFVFADLSCQKEGVFVPRWRCMNVTSPADGHDAFPVLGEVFGAPFRVYPTRSTPRLPPSTELTKELLRLGVRVHARTDGISKARKSHKGAKLKKREGGDDDGDDENEDGHYHSDEG